MYRTDYESFKAHYEQSQKYVNCLETQIVNMKDKINRLNKIAIRYKEKTEIADSTLIYANKGKQSALYKLHDSVKDKHA